MDQMANHQDPSQARAGVTYTTTLIERDNKVSVQTCASDPGAYQDTDEFGLYTSLERAKEDSGRDKLDLAQNSHRASGPRVDERGGCRVWKANERQQTGLVGAYYYREGNGTLTLVSWSKPLA
ncbi:MAG: hypothetical protein AB1Z98_33085 [Nannocystaceae bacterium]